MNRLWAEGTLVRCLDNFDAFNCSTGYLVECWNINGRGIVAAFDHQHPRDLFDMRHLLQNEGLDDALRRAFIVYLVSHDRPMFEVLAGTRRDISKEFDRGFEGMTAEPVLLRELLDAHKEMIDLVVGRMPDEHRRFLISFEKGEPDWSLLAATVFRNSAQEGRKS